jgi:hypothetical protein
MLHFVYNNFSVVEPLAAFFPEYTAEPKNSNQDGAGVSDSRFFLRRAYNLLSF